MLDLTPSPQLTFRHKVQLTITIIREFEIN